MSITIKKSFPVFVRAGPVGRKSKWVMPNFFVTSESFS